MALNESPLIRSEAPNVAASGRVEHPGVLQTSRRSLIEADEERVDHEEHSATTARGVLTSRVSATGKVGEYAGLELLDWYARGDATARVEHLHDISAEMQAAPGARRLRTSAGERGERTVKVISAWFAWGGKVAGQPVSVVRAVANRVSADRR